MCNRCNCGCNSNFQRCNCFDGRNGCGCGCNNSFDYDPFREVERIARQERRHRCCEDRCAREFIRCMRRCENCDWD